MIDPAVDVAEFMKRIRRLELRTERRVDELLVGRWHAAFKGRGMEFEEVRPYIEGDDVRLIDWNVTARADRPYIKRMREEREMSVTLMVDTTGSMHFGTTTLQKVEYVTELAATLALSAIRNNDRVGLHCFGNGSSVRLPGRTGMRHVLRIIRELLMDTLHNANESIDDMTAMVSKEDEHSRPVRFAIDRLMRQPTGRQVVFLISDFREDHLRRSLSVMSQAHDVVPIVVEDPIEQHLPPGGLVRVRDRESGRTRILDLASPRRRRQTQLLLDNERQRVEALFRSCSLSAIWLRTDEDFFDPIRRFLETRRTSA